VTFESTEGVDHVIPRWSPDGSKIVFQNVESTNFDVRVVDVETRRMVWVTRDVFQDLNPVWSSSGEAIYFSSYRSGGLNVWRVPVAADGSPAGLPQHITTGAGEDVQLAISVDGSHIAMSILRLNADIWWLPIDAATGMPTGEPQAVVSTTREDSRAAWSPDGRMIAFNSDRGGDMNLWVGHLDDGSERQITKGPGGDYQPNWSPSGKRLTFFSSRTGNADVWLVEVDSGELQQLTTNASLDINPSFSPDGDRIAYQSDLDGRKELWVMAADGSDQRQLTNTGASGHFILWSSDGKNVIYRAPGGRTFRAPVDGGDPELLVDVRGGAHMSFSPDNDMIMDVTGHKVLWVTALATGTVTKVFEFDNPENRIDYPVWAPDGKRLLFDRVKPQDGDIWIIENFE
jgi:TolB protein